MKKLAFLLVLILIMIVGCNTQTDSQESADTKKEATQTDNDEETYTSNLEEIISSGESYKCIIMSEGAESTVYYKNEKQRIETTVEGTNVISIYDDDVMYTWETDTNTGSKLDLKRIQDMDEELGGDFEEPQTPEEIQESAGNVKCRKEVISDDMFIPPENIAFEDLNELIEQMEALQGNLV